MSLMREYFTAPLFVPRPERNRKYFNHTRRLEMSTLSHTKGNRTWCHIDPRQRQYAKNTCQLQSFG